MKKYFLKIFTGILCLALLVTACAPIISPEESPGSESSDSSSSDSSQVEETNPISYPEWADELIWQNANIELYGDTYSLPISGYNGEEKITANMLPQLYNAIKYSSDNCIFCVSIHSKDCNMLDYLGIEYGPISKTDFIYSPKDDPDDYVRAYVSREQIRTLIIVGLCPVLTTPERPAGYSETIADSLAFLLETSSQDTYSVQYSTTLPYVHEKEEARWDRYYESNKNEAIEATREDILSLADDPDVYLIYIPYSMYEIVFHTSVKDGQPKKDTEWMKPLPFPETRELWELHMQYDRRLFQLFGIPEHVIAQAEKESFESWSPLWKKEEDE